MYLISGMVSSGGQTWEEVLVGSRIRFEAVWTVFYGPRYELERWEVLGLGTYVPWLANLTI